MTRCGNHAPTSVTPATSTMNSERSSVLFAQVLATAAWAAVPKREAIMGCWWRTAPAQEPDGATT